PVIKHYRHNHCPRLTRPRCDLAVDGHARRPIKGSIMTVLITGGAGYIGSHMVHELVDAGESVVVLDNLSTGFDWAVAAGVPLIVGETGNERLVGQIIREHRVEAIIH